MTHADPTCGASQSSSATPLKVMIMGAPAAGKGTQCEKIVEKVPCLPAPPLRSAADAAHAVFPCCRIRHEICVTQYKLVHISVGDLLRAEVAAGTPAGRRAQSFMDSGNLVPNEVLLDRPPVPRMYKDTSDCMHAPGDSIRSVGLESEAPGGPV